MPKRSGPEVQYQYGSQPFALRHKKCSRIHVESGGKAQLRKKAKSELFHQLGSMYQHGNHVHVITQQFTFLQNQMGAGSTVLQSEFQERKIKRMKKIKSTKQSKKAIQTRKYQKIVKSNLGTYQNASYEYQPEKIYKKQSKKEKILTNQENVEFAIDLDI